MSRQEVVLTRYPTNQIRFYNGTRIQIDPEKTVYLTRDGSGIADAFAAQFQALGIRARLIDVTGDAPDLPDAAGIVALPDAFKKAGDEPARSFLFYTFDLIRKNAGHLNRSPGEAFFAALSFSGGGFGFDTAPAAPVSPAYGGLAGLVKTAHLEWPHVLCRALDLPADPKAVIRHAEAAVALMMTHGEVEMGLDGDNCAIPTLTEKEIRPAPVALGNEDVVVITGGAKGVTAECALALAETCSPKIVLLGRSAEPFDEPEWIQGIDDPGKMKKVLIANGFDGEKPTPAAVEKQYRAICSNRNIKKNIRRIRARAAQVRYHSLDIRNGREVAAVMADIQKTMGCITAVIHGAGVLRDKLIADKRLEQFKQVFETKVEGLAALLGAVDQDDLKYLVLFSSVAARLGNPGQCDYAAANEVLNKMAQAKARSLDGCRVVSLNWGPWDGGMVTDALKREFDRRGVALIPLAAGARQLLVEMGNPDRQCVEVVIGGHLNPPAPKKEPVLTRALTQTLGHRSCPVVNHHEINGEPIVPLALMADLLACAAEKNNPGLTFAGMDRMRLLKGISPGEKEIPVRVNTGKCVPENGMYSASGTLTSGKDPQTRHAEADLLLADRLPAPPVLSEAAFMDLSPCSMSPEDAYDKVLFHGDAFQSIVDIPGVSAKGIEIVAKQAPAPEHWYASPHSRKWTLDPLMLDSAFQAAILWTWETRGQVCLPSFFANLRLYASYPGQKGRIRILFTVSHETRHKVQGYFTFLDETDTVIASIMGFEAFIDPGLMDKFKPKPLFERDRILAFAQGKPSEAFGAPYRVFDADREIARLPRPPYFFMDRVIRADHTPWEMAPGGWIETVYEIPEKAWYFRANRTSALPFCILLEIALQPCGWLAAYAGSALTSDQRLHFRNLGGKATLIENLGSQSGPVMVRARMTEVSKAGGMIIQDFDMEVRSKGRIVYQGRTNFGFFTGQALANQVGIRNSRFFFDLDREGLSPAITFDDDAPLTPEDTASSPDSGMPSKALRMIDAVEHLDVNGGLYDKGCIQAVKQVDDKEWFFRAHFYQDPVCPGSLGVESFLQMLRFFALKKYDIAPEAYTVTMGENHEHRWIYRGQIVPSNSIVRIQAHIKACTVDGSRYTIVADGALTVDGICIYEMEDFSIQLVPVSDATSADLGRLRSQSV